MTTALKTKQDEYIQAAVMIEKQIQQEQMSLRLHGYVIPTGKFITCREALTALASANPERTFTFRKITHCLRAMTCNEGWCDGNISRLLGPTRTGHYVKYEAPDPERPGRLRTYHTLSFHACGFKRIRFGIYRSIYR